jgi:hypothetical protein
MDFRSPNTFCALAIKVLGLSDAGFAKLLGSRSPVDLAFCTAPPILPPVRAGTYFGFFHCGSRRRIIKKDPVMMNLLSTEIRREPYPLYDRLRTSSPWLRVPPPFDAWMIFDYEGLKWALNDHETFSSRVPAPQWFIFFDAPAHTKLRALVSQAFTPRMVANLDRSIRELSRQLLDQTIERGEMNLPNDFSAPLAMQVIAGIIGIPSDGLGAIQTVERCHS